MATDYRLVTNPDEVKVFDIRKAIRDNGGYCATKIKHIPENKCPCKEATEQGKCECGLYIKVE